MTQDPTTTPPAPPPPPERWDRDHRRRRFHRRHHRFHGLLPGLVLVAWGGMLLLREMGYLSAELHPFDFWPLILIGAGISMALRRFRLGSALVGLAIAALGAGLLAQKLGYLAGIAHLWPLLLIAAGVGIILNGFARRSHPLARLPDEKVSADELQRSVSMGGLAVAVDSQQFKGGALAVTMGEIKADLRRAALAGEEVTLDVSVTMGGIELYVPSNWQVVSDVSPFMGSVEDKTDPRPDGTGVQRRLVLRGSITMGAVTIRN
jgi:predicted membrane protein